MTNTPIIAKGLSDQALLSELARMKALFQARAIAAVLGVDPPDHLQSGEDRAGDGAL